MMMRERLAMSVLALLATQQVVAHDTWIAPDRFTARRGDTITLHMTSGMEFPKLDFAIKPDRVTRATIRIGRRSFLIPPTAAANSLDFPARLRRTGIATVAVELGPKSIELTPEQVVEYLDEIGADPELRKQWEARPEPKRWKEIYTKHAKSFLLIEHSDDSWREPAGLEFELVPLADPTALRAGGALPLRLIESGKALPDFPVGIVHESDTHGVILKTDAEGRVSVPLPKAGRYLVRATYLRQVNRTDANWMSDFTTLTVDVKN